MPGARAKPLMTVADVVLDPSAGRATRGGRALDLSAREFALLSAFMRREGDVVGRAQLYEQVWGGEYDGLSNVLDVYVNYLRNKLEAEGGTRLIHTVRGRGYVFAAEY